MLNSTELKGTQNIKLYHFVHTILSVPFCPIPFCPYTILSIPFCPLPFCPVTHDSTLDFLATEHSQHDIPKSPCFAVKCRFKLYSFTVVAVAVCRQYIKRRYNTILPISTHSLHGRHIGFELGRVGVI